MTRRTVLWAVLCALVGAPRSLAQSRGAKADPISGTWTGELKSRWLTNPFDHDGAEVRRQEQGDRHLHRAAEPGDVKAGTFDPKTGALKLELGKAEGPEVLIVLEGSLVKGVATGKVTGEAGTGDFKIAKKP